MNALHIQKSFALLAFAAAAAFAQADRGQLASTSVEQLKAAYLDCDRRSTRAVLDSGSVRACSLIAEELLQRAFAGNFEELLAWWRVAAKGAERVGASQI
jgi:hypothetical protein